MRKRVLKLVSVLLMCMILVGAVPATAFAATKLAAPKITYAFLADSGDGIYLEWSSIKNAKKYEVALSIDGAKYKKIKTTDNDCLYYDKITKSGKYSFKVRAINGKTKSDYSKVKTIKVDLWNTSQAYADILKDLKKKAFSETVKDDEGFAVATNMKAVKKAIRFTYKEIMGEEFIEATMDLSEALLKKGKTTITIKGKYSDGSFTANAVVDIKKYKNADGLKFKVTKSEGFEEDSIIQTCIGMADASFGEWQNALLDYEGYSLENLGFAKIQGLDFDY